MSKINISEDSGEEKKHIKEIVKDTPTPDPCEVTPRDRLNILRNVLYWGGGFYIAIIVALIVLGALEVPYSTSELTTLITLLGSILTTIIGVIIGSSLNSGKINNSK